MNFESYQIPANYTDAGKMFGLFPLRNLVEAVLVSAPIIYFALVFLPFDITNNIIVTMIIVVPLGGFTLIGVNDDCITRFIGNWISFRRSRRIITYRGSISKRRRRKWG